MGEYPDMPFNQQMSFPCELTLRDTPTGLRMFRNPVAEIEELHRKRHFWHDEEIVQTSNPLEVVQSDLLEIRAEIDPGDAKELIFSIRGETVRYESKSGRLSCGGGSAFLSPTETRLSNSICSLIGPQLRYSPMMVSYP